MSQVPIWNGNKDLNEQPTSPQWTYQPNKIQAIRTFEGPYLACLEGQPVRGSQSVGYPTFMVAQEIKVNNMPGGKGQLIITLESLGSESSGGSQQPIYEIEWAPISQRLEQAPCFQESGSYPLSILDLAALQAWDNEPDYANRSAFKFVSASMGVQTLSTNAQVYAKKKLKGTDSYTVRSPICRQTVESFTFPASNPCDVVSNPTVPDAPAGYVYIHSASRGTKTGKYGKWQLIDEWTGVITADPDLYPGG